MLKLPSLGLFFASLLAAASQSITLQDDGPTKLDTLIVKKYVNAAQASLSGNSDARGLITEALKQKRFYSDDPGTPNLDNPSFYCVIHVVVWEDAKEIVQEGKKKIPQTIKAQHWYLYNGGKSWGQDDFTSNKRIFGAKHLNLLYVYLHTEADITFSARYEVVVTSKEPANIQHLLQAAAAFVPAPSEGAKFEPKYQDYLGLADFNVSYVPSDVSFTPYFVETERTALGDSIVFDNEGTYYWDASVAVPIRKMGQTKIDNVNNTVTVNKPDKRNVFAVLDLYPFKKDVKSPGFDWRPYGVTGVAVGSQPLHKILVGAGWGPKYAQFYAGALFAKQADLKSLKNGSMASSAQQAADTQVVFKPQFAFGINLPVREVFQAASSAAKKGPSGKKTTAKK